MKFEKATVRLKLLLNKIIDYKKSAFFGVPSENTETKNIWSEYSEIRKILTEFNPELFSDLKELSPPSPGQASSFSHHDPGTPIYGPNHFDPILNEVKKALDYGDILIQNENSKSDQKSSGKISINAVGGSSVNLLIGDNNKVLQNTNQIDKVLNDLKDMGVHVGDLQVLKEIINQNAQGDEGKLETGKRILSWIGTLTQNLVVKGITEHIPLIISKAQSLIDLI